jgi:hypothetical protein
MTVLAQTRAAIGGDPQVLRAVCDEDCNLAIWERQPAADWSALLAGDPCDIRFESPIAKVRERFFSELPDHGFDAPALHDALADDVAMLADRFAAVLDVFQVQVRLEVVSTDSCRKFHADYVRARLITTYAGDGTQWLDAGAAARLRDGVEPETIHQLTAGDVGIFKGKLASEQPAIHRSPPLGESGRRRLLLVLNPAEE